MKLKKIASLMLVGVMAVSMLAGCSTASNGNNNGEGEGENGGTTTGYSVTFGEKLSSDVKNKDYVSFADNAADQAALADALNNVGALKTLIATANDEITYLNGGDVVGVVEDFTDSAKLTRYGFNNGAGNVFNNKNTLNRTTKVGSIYYVDGSVSMDKVLNQIANKLDSYFKKLAETGEIKDSDGNQVTYDFDYTISVSVVNKTSDVIDWYNGSTNVVAVTVTRTATAD